MAPSFHVEDRLTNKMLREWLTPKLQSGAKVIGGRFPDMPNRIVSVQLQSGPGLDLDGIFDTQLFQISCRGAENNLDDAEAIALDVDNVIIGRTQHPVVNFEMHDGEASSVYVSGMGRTGGPPQQLPILDADSRYIFTCTYFISASTSVGQVN